MVIHTVLMVIIFQELFMKQMVLVFYTFLYLLPSFVYVTVSVALFFSPFFDRVVGKRSVFLPQARCKLFRNIKLQQV